MTEQMMKAQIAKLLHYMSDDREPGAADTYTRLMRNNMMATPMKYLGTENGREFYDWDCFRPSIHLRISYNPNSNEVTLHAFANRTGFWSITE